MWNTILAFQIACSAWIFGNYFCLKTNISWVTNFEDLFCDPCNFYHLLKIRFWSIWGSLVFHSLNRAIQKDLHFRVQISKVFTTFSAWNSSNASCSDALTVTVYLLHFPSDRKEPFLWIFSKNLQKSPLPSVCISLILFPQEDEGRVWTVPRGSQSIGIHFGSSKFNHVKRSCAGVHVDHVLFISHTFQKTCITIWSQLPTDLSGVCDDGQEVSSWLCTIHANSFKPRRHMQRQEFACRQVKTQPPAIASFGSPTGIDGFPVGSGRPRVSFGHWDPRHEIVVSAHALLYAWNAWYDISKENL